MQPQLDAYELALESDPLAEIDDFMTFKNLPETTRAKLDERQEWVKKVWRDGDKLTTWAAARSKFERAERQRAKEVASSVTQSAEAQ
ncbi:hypothetical protein JCM10212_004444 [Sporobolomyces blumeae]